jgi:3D (Asp-Asp-Asp) domain-containing protein
MISTIIVRGAISLALATLPTVTSTLPIERTFSGVAEAAAQTADEDRSNAAPEAETREEAVRSLRVSVTAYSSTPDQTDSTPFITANGSHVRDGIIAANFLPFGARVRFPDLFGDKVFTVEDRMHQRFKYRADIWMETRQAARNFGVKRNVLIEVLPDAPKEIAKKS